MSHDATNWALNLPLDNRERVGASHATARLVLICMADHVQPLSPRLFEDTEWKWGPLPSELGAIYAAQDTIAAWCELARSAISNTLTACTLSGVLLRHPDTDLTRALTMNITARKYQPGHRNNWPLTYLLNDRIVKKDAKAWLPEAFDAAWTYTRTSRPGQEVTAAFQERMTSLVPDHIWPDGFSFEEALHPPRPDKVLASGLSVPRPATRHVRRDAVQAHPSTTASDATTKPRAAKRATQVSAQAQEILEWWMSQVEVSDHRVNVVRRTVTKIATIHLDEGKPAEVITEALRRTLPRACPQEGRVEDNIVQILRERGEVPANVHDLSAARSRRSTHRDNAAEAAIAGAAHPTAAPVDEDGWMLWAADAPDPS